MDTVILDQLIATLGALRVLSTQADMAPYLEDWRGRYRGSALAVVLPSSVDEVAAVVRICASERISIVPQGGNTGLCGGATPLPEGRSVVINLSRMNRIRAIDTDNNTLTVEAGCTLAAVQEAAAGIDRLFPLSLASEGSCEIGGNLSTNAGGVHVLRYGNMRELTLGLEVVLPDGRIWNGLRALRKDNTGYDLKQLFIGAEGTLGIVTAAVLRLFPRARSRVAAWLDMASPAAAIGLLGELQTACGERLTAFEIIGREALELVRKHLPAVRPPFATSPEWSVLVELTDPGAGAGLEGVLEQALAAAIEADLVRDAAIASSIAQTEALWALRENISEAQRIEGISIKHDISVPVSRVAEFIERAGQELHARWPEARIVVFGHLGDGNLHYNLSRPDATSNDEFIEATPAVNRVVHDLAHRLGGSISAEHGLGQLKKGEIRRYKDEVELDLMRRIKSAVDPLGLMNPGKVI